MEELEKRFVELQKLQQYFQVFLKDMSGNIENSAENILRNCVNLKNKIKHIKDIIKEQINQAIQDKAILDKEPKLDNDDTIPEEDQKSNNKDSNFDNNSN